MKIMELTEQEVQLIQAMVTQGQWAVARTIVSLQDKCAHALKGEDASGLQDRAGNARKGGRSVA